MSNSPVRGPLAFRQQAEGSAHDHTACEGQSQIMEPTCLAPKPGSYNCISGNRAQATWKRLGLCCPVSLAWLLGTWDVAGGTDVTKELNFMLNSSLWLVATV